MTKRYPGGYITKTAPTVSTTSAPGIWTMEQQAAYKKAGTWPFGGPFNYIEDVFSTYLYTGNGSTQTITNGIDLSGKGGMVWGKTRDAVVAFTITDTVRGVDKELFTNTTDAQVTRAAGTGSVYAFNSNGFSTSAVNGFINYSGLLAATWTFREQPKFFDIVTYTGNGNNRTIAHSLGSAPGCIIIKCTSAASPWPVYHRGLTDASTSYVSLNTTASRNVAATYWNSTAPTSTVFSLGTSNDVNQSGQTYVAYLFAHNAGGFGPTETDNVITCGNFTTDGSGYANIDLGYEPQWVLAKRTSTNDSWLLVDNMRAFVYGPAVNTSDDARLVPNSDSAENINDFGRPTATGFEFNVGTTNSPYIYIAIRRGPMKTPTSGTSVFDTALYTGNATARTVTLSSTMPYTDMGIWRARSGGTNQFNQGWWTVDRLRGMASTPSSAGVVSLGLLTAYTDAEGGGAPYSVINNTADLTASTSLNVNTAPFLVYSFRRAPGFFDEVCYTGTGSATTVTHNLGVVPELMIVKRRDTATNWPVYSQTTGNTKYLYLNSSAAAGTFAGTWNSTTPTATSFYVGADNETNGSGGTFVNYLFASCPGVSKVGSYTGTGATQTISCGFAARFVLIKRTDSTGDWFVWDTARGMVAGTDPRLALNSTAAEANNNWVYTDAAGFQIVTTDATVNASGGSYIYLAIS